MANINNAIRALDDAISDVERLRRKAQADRLPDEIVRKLKRLESDLDDLMGDLQSIKRDID